MRTEHTDTYDKIDANRPSATVRYDGTCELCSAWVEQHRDDWIVRGIAAKPATAAAGEIRLETEDGDVLGGVDAILALNDPARFSSRWLSRLSRIPAVHRMLKHGYRWIATRRNCLPGRGALLKTAAWLLFYAALFRAGVYLALPAWITMWTLVGVMLVACKWQTLNATRPNLRPSGPGQLAYLLSPTLDPLPFRKRTHVHPSPGSWIRGVVATVAGAALFWWVTPQLVAKPLVIAWSGMLGMIFLLHFGLARLVVLLFQHAGFQARPIMNEPSRATSVSELWGRRWNLAFRDWAHLVIFRPLVPLVGARAASFWVFLASGPLHELAVSVPARGGYGLPTLYFLIQYVGLQIERTGVGRRLGLGRGVAGWLFTMTVALGPVGLLYHMPFIENVMLPLLNAIGARHV